MQVLMEKCMSGFGFSNLRILSLEPTLLQNLQMILYGSVLNNSKATLKTSEEHNLT